MLNRCKFSGRLGLAVLASFVAMVGLTTQAQSVTNGLVAYWNFDAKNFTDSIAKFDGTANGTAPIAFVAGKPGFGQAIQLDGVDEMVEITGGQPDDLAFEGGSVSVAAWFTADTFDKSWQALVAKGEGSSWRVARRGTENSIAYAGGVGEGADDAPDVSDGNWHHMVAISDANAANFGTALYVDGKQYSVNASAPNLAANGKGMMIGENPDARGRYWNGKIDDVAVWGRVLTEAEITALYAGGTGKPISSFFGAVPTFSIGSPSGTVNGFTLGVSDAGAAVADPNSIVLKFNGTQVTPTTVTKTNGITTIAYNVPNPPLASGATNATSLTIKDTTGKSYSSDATFVVPAYATIQASFAVTGVDTTKPGFKVKPYQVSAGQPNTIAWTEEMFAGLHGTNIADLTQTISGKPIGADGFYTYTGLINWDKDGSNDGNFQDSNGYTDTVMPGQPSADGSSTYANDGEEVLTFVQFPSSGFYTMGVNSDDGFKVSAGPNPRDAFQSVTLGMFNGGRGASDTTFKFYVAAQGIYPMRLLWENGGSGANCEWFTVQPDKTKILLNDPSATNTTGVKAFYSGPATPSPAYVLSFTPGITGGKLLIADAGTKVAAGSAKVSLNGTPATTTSTQANGVTTVNYSLATPFPSGTSVALSLTYKDSASANISNGTTYVSGAFTGVTKDSVKGYAGYIRGGKGGFTADAGGHTGKPGDYAIDTTKTSGTWVDIEDVSFINAAAANDTLSIAMWIKKYDIAAGSAFWAPMGAVATGTDLRGFQAHVPWSDDNIYFDTAGCCDGGAQRISANISTFADYTTVGTDAYWTNSWHHFVFTKKKDQKNIYIDGKLFLNGSSTDPLQPNFTGLGLLTDGVPGGDFMHGLIDDFAVFSSEISAADAAKLAAGTSPKALTGEQLVAFWDFNDAAATPAPGSSISKLTLSSDRKSLSVTYTGTLQSADVVLGPWTDVANATSPATIAIGTGSKFYRVH